MLETFLNFFGAAELIGKEAVRTQGEGNARLDLDLQIGDIEVWLD